MKTSFTTAAASVFAITIASLSLIGCSAHTELDSDSISTKTSALVTRAHHEEIDSDGMFFTYWERAYNLGSAAMELIPTGYTANVDYTTVTEISNPNFVVGKGRDICWEIG